MQQQIEGAPENQPVMWVRYVVHSRAKEYEAAGWVYVGPLPFPHGLYSSLWEWPSHLGEPVEPTPEAH